MKFHPGTTKEAQEVIFSRKINKIDHPLLHFNQNSTKSLPAYKELGMHLEPLQSKVNNAIGLLCKLQNTLTLRTLFITIYKSFIRPTIFV